MEWGLVFTILAIAYAMLEVRHMFHGAYLDRGSLGDAELYAYSATWLVFGLALLGGALLTGLLRALSFLGLGGTLVGIGLLYQRFVFRREPANHEAAIPG